MKSMSHAPHDERLRIVAERQRQCDQIAAVLRTMKERIERKDELLHGYERDLAKLRSAEETIRAYFELSCFTNWRELYFFQTSRLNSKIYVVSM